MSIRHLCIFAWRPAHSPQRATTLLAVVLFSAIVLLVAASTFSSIQFQARMASRSFAFQQALEVAEAGAECAMAELNKSSAQWNGWTQTGTSYTKSEQVQDHAGAAMGSFSVTVSGVGGTTPLIDSLGTVNSGRGAPVSRRLRVGCLNNLTRSPFGEFGIFSTNNIIQNSNNTIDSYDSRAGLYNADGNCGANANVGAVGQIIMNSNSRINGSIQAGGSIIWNSGVVVTGETLPNNAPTPPPPFPEADLQAAKTNNNNANVRQLRRNNRRFVDYPLANTKTLHADSNRIIVFPPGVYYLQGVTLNSNCDLEIDPPGPVTIYLDGPWIMNSGNTVNANTRNPKLLSIFGKSGTFNLNSNVSMYAGLYAPWANITTFNSNTQFYGSVVAHGLTFNSNCGVHCDVSMGLPAGASSGVLAQWWSEWK